MAGQALVRRLIDRVKRVERTKVSWCQAVVTDNDPLTVRLAGSDVEVRVRGIDGLGYDINAVVTVLVRDTDMLALGASTGSPGGLVTYAAGDGLDLSSGVFAVDLKPSGGLKVESTELAADVGSSAGQVAAGNDSRFPSSGEKSALAGTSGSPGSGNKYVTDADSRNTNSRTPTAHAASHKDAGSDELKLHELGEPTGPVDFNGQELEHVGVGTQADSGVNLSQLDLVRMGFTVRPQADYATVQALDSYTGTGTAVLEASANGTLLDALGLESEHWDYALTFFAVGRPYAIATDGTYFYVTLNIAGNHRVGKFDSSGQPVLSFSGAAYFGADGSGDGQFGGPCRGITVDSSGNIYVADSSNNRIQKFNSSGVYQAKVGSSGSGNGQFSGLRGLARDSSNNIYSAEQGNHRVQKFNSSLTYQSQFGSFGSSDGQFQSPAGIAIDGSNNIYVVDYRVQKFNSSGTFQSKFGSFGSDDGEFVYPFGIAVDSSNNIYVPDTGNSRVQKFNSSGVYQAKVGSYGTAHGQFRSPLSLAVNSSGDLYVADGDNQRVEKLTHTAGSSVDTGKSVIVKDQAYGGPHIDHGVFDITNTGGVSAKWKLTRRDDLDDGAEIMSGLLIAARQRGPTIPGGMWYVSNPDPITIGSTAIVWEQFQPGGPPSAHQFTHAYDGTDPIIPEDWTEVGTAGAPAFLNSWVNFGSGLETAGFYKDPLGIVHVKGVIKSGTTASCFQLPAGYRPAATEIFACQGNNGSNIIARIDIGASGNIGVQTASATFLSLSGITFRAA